MAPARVCQHGGTAAAAPARARRPLVRPGTYAAKVPAHVTFTRGLMADQDSSTAEPGTVSEHIAQNIETMATLHAAAEGRVGRHQRAIETLTASIGRPQSLQIILASVAGWTVYNGLAPSVGAPQLDPPPYFWLQGTISLCALLVTTMVLTTQNRQGKRAAQRDHLDLQVNLVAEQKIAKLVSLLEELRRDLPSVHDRVDPIADAMTQAVDPHAVVSVLEQTLEDSEKAHGSIKAGPDVVDHEPKPR